MRRSLALLPLLLATAACLPSEGEIATPPEPTTTDPPTVTIPVPPMTTTTIPPPPPTTAPPPPTTAPPPPTTVVAPPPQPSSAPVQNEQTEAGYSASGNVNGYPCGGDLPPCSVLACESGGNPTAENPNSSASGLWQFLDSTWNGHGGYARASHAPASVQNSKAAALWAGGAGASHWAQCL